MKRHFQYPSSLLYRYKNSLVITILGLFLVSPVSAQLAFDNPESCKNCHSRQYNEWQGSMMAYSTVSPTFNALEHLGNHSVHNDLGENGQFAAGSGADSELFCQACHTPSAVALDDARSASSTHWLLSPFDEESSKPTIQMLNDIAGDSSHPLKDEAETAMHGVSCDVCHQAIGESHTTSAFFYAEDIQNGVDTGIDNGIANASFMFAADSIYKYGPFSNMPGDAHPACQPTPYGTSSPGCAPLDSNPEKGGYLTSSQFCGSCHDVRPGNPLYGAAFPSPKPSEEKFLRLENLYTEYSESQWAANGVTCQDCHMSTYPYGADPGNVAEPGRYPVATVAHVPGSPLSVIGSPREVSSHYFTGVDVSLDSNFSNRAGYDSQTSLAKQKVTIANNKSVYMPIAQQQRREDLLKSAVDMKVDFDTHSFQRYGFIKFDVTLENVGAGHNVPSGFSQERQFWIGIELADANGTVLFESGFLEDSDSDGKLNDESLNDYPHLEEEAEDLEISSDSLAAFIADGAELSTTVAKDLTVADFDIIRALGSDPQLQNFGNKFRRQAPDSNGYPYTGGAIPGNGLEVFSPFLADEMDNSHSLAPHSPETFTYTKSNIFFNVGELVYPLKAKVTLNFRAFPPNFLNGLEHAMELEEYNGEGLLPDHIADMNKIIVMAQEELSITEGGDFAIISANGRCFERGSSLPGTVQLWSCNSNSKQDVEFQSSGQIKFSDGGCLTVNRSDYDNNAKISNNPTSITVGVESCVTNPNTDNAHQVWSMTGDGQISIYKSFALGTYANYCLQRNPFDGYVGHLILNHCEDYQSLGQNNNYLQQFFYEPNFRPVVTDGGKCLELAGNTFSSGASAQISTCDGEPRQKWQLTKTGFLINAGGLCLDIYGGVQAGSVNGYHCSEQNNPSSLSANQRWKFEGGSLVSSFDGSGESFCLGTENASTVDGTAVETVACDTYSAGATFGSAGGEASTLKWSLGTTDTVGFKGDWNPSGGRNVYSSQNIRYQLDLIEEQEVYIDLSSNVDTYLYVLNATGQIINNPSADDDRGPGLNSRSVMVLQPGTYYILAATYSSGKVADFNISVSRATDIATSKNEAPFELFLNPL